MELTYMYTKWEKEQKRCIKDKWLKLSEKNISSHIFSYTNPDEFVAKYKFARPTKDKMTLYNHLSNDYLY